MSVRVFLLHSQGILRSLVEKLSLCFFDVSEASYARLTYARMIGEYHFEVVRFVPSWFSVAGWHDWTIEPSAAS